MEAFEHVVRVFLETQRFAVTSNVKFPIRRESRKLRARNSRHTATKSTWSPLAAITCLPVP